jgi:hypothetical protein
MAWGVKSIHDFGVSTIFIQDLHFFKLWLEFTSLFILEDTTASSRNF